MVHIPVVLTRIPAIAWRRLAPVAGQVRLRLRSARCIARDWRRSCLYVQRHRRPTGRRSNCRTRRGRIGDATTWLGLQGEAQGATTQTNAEPVGHRTAATDDPGNAEVELSKSKESDPLLLLRVPSVQVALSCLVRSESSSRSAPHPRRASATIDLHARSATRDTDPSSVPRSSQARMA